MMRFILGFLIAFASVQAQAGPEGDPFASITRFQLENGLVVYLAPNENAKNVAVRMMVGVGSRDEKDHEIGVAHVTEHTLFRHPSFPKNMSLLQLIEEAGGTANGYTKGDETLYLATVKPYRGPWLLNQFTKILMNRKLSEEYVNKAKKEVLLELGETDSELFTLIKKLKPYSPALPDFWESEFGIKFSKHKPEEERVGSQNLSPNQVQEFYNQYYHPNNMRLYVAGKFNLEETTAQIRNLFSHFEKNRLPLPERPKPVAKKGPYKTTDVSARDSYISVGVKIWDADPEDETVLNVYLEYLAHRIMKEIRNEKAETYTATPSVVSFDRIGYGIIGLETPRNRFRANLHLINEYLRKETQEGGFSKSDYDKAMDLYDKKFGQGDNDAQSLMSLIESYYSMKKDYNDNRTPYQVFASLNEKEFAVRLKKVFAPERRYSYLKYPPYIFRGEHYIIYGLFIGLALVLFRFVAEKPFNHRKVRYVRKIKYAPLTVAKLGVLTSALASILFTYSYINDVIRYQLGLNGSLILNIYVMGFWEIVTSTAFVLFCLSVVPRKIIVCDHVLIVKSLTYWSWSIPFSKIKSMEVLTPYQAFLKYNPRTRFFHWSILRKGILFNVEGRIMQHYYFGFLDADEVYADLKAILEEDKTLVQAGPNRAA